MKLSGMLEIVRDIPAINGLQALVARQGQHMVQVLEAAKPCLIAALHESAKGPVIVLCANPEAARELHEQLVHWCPEGALLYRFPERDALPHERLAADPAVVIERMKTLSALSGWGGGMAWRAVDIMLRGPLVLTSVATLMTRMLSPERLRALAREIGVGMVAEPDWLIAQWEAMGYYREDTVEVPGTMGRRGGIVDIFPITSSLPVRIEFVGDKVESLRLFDPANQRSLEAVQSIMVTPAAELLFPQGEGREAFDRFLKRLDLSGCDARTREEMGKEIAQMVEGQRFEGADFYLAPSNDGMMLDFLPSNSLLILNEPEEVNSAGEELEVEVEQLWKQQLQRGSLPRDFPKPYWPRSEWQKRLEKVHRSLSLRRWLSRDGDEISLPFEPSPRYGGHLPVFLEGVKQSLKGKGRLVVVTQQAERLSELLADRDVIAPVTEALQPRGAQGSLSLVHGSLAEGWMVDKAVTLLTDTELFGITKKPLLVKRRPVRRGGFVSVPSPDSYVVHVDHGVARFAGVTRRSFGDGEGEFLVLEYSGGDRLFVPVGQIDRVTPYIGPGEGPPALSRLGSQEWSRTKERIKASVAKTAQDLLSLYAARRVAPGFAFSADTPWQQELEASFAYVETPDQARAMFEVKGDMEAPHPMDRLICGDVGYGKTEVALRAAFKTVMNGKQVAMLVPTTILAQQHYNTFKERLEPFPVRVEVLSRFRSEREQDEVVRGLAGGSIDICIGTHRLLQKDVVFKDLGLVIVDEEQRFGVLHKERLKQMRQDVDVLALSATPIPRTLYMSLVGIRDMSTIETPPEERLPVRSYVAGYDDALVREAILREMERNGQVFFVHNRVQTIGLLASRLKEIVPEARLAVAHGQMPEEELEKVMLDFAGETIDVLACTTIIESGLDLPRVNTLIIDNADRLGLTQLYQLRGRVGRGTQRAYAYFLYQKGKKLTPEAEKRLRTMFEAQELGSGFHIAMKDLEIRGAGNLLGVEQSGYISAVGFELYCRLLAQAVEELTHAESKVSEMKTEEAPPPTVDLPLSAYLPEDYVPHLATRLALYQRLTRVRSVEEIDGLAQELRDRFGEMPLPAQNLLYIVKVRILAGMAGVEAIYQEGREMVMRFWSRRVESRVLSVGEYKKGVTVGSYLIRLQRVVLQDKWPEVLESILVGCLER